jgi:hypothetical protein
MWHVWGRREIPRGFWWENLKGRDDSEDIGVCGRINVKMYHEEISWEGLIVVRMRTNGELL